MKHLLIIVVILTTQTLLSQVGQVAADILVDVGSSTLPETQALVATHLHQQAVHKYSKNIAEKTVQIAVLKEAELASLSENPDRLEATGAWQFTLSAIEKIISLNAETVALAEQDPDVYDIPIDLIPVFLESATSIFVEMQEYIISDNDHLMTAPDRFTLIRKANIKLAKLVELSNYLNRLMKLAPLLNDEPIESMEFDFSTPIDDFNIYMDNLIQE